MGWGRALATPSGHPSAGSAPKRPGEVRGALASDAVTGPSCSFSPVIQAPVDASAPRPQLHRYDTSHILRTIATVELRRSDTATVPSRSPAPATGRRFGRPGTWVFGAHTFCCVTTCRTLASKMPPSAIFLTLSALCRWETELGPQDRPGKVRMRFVFFLAPPAPESAPCRRKRR